MSMYYVYFMTNTNDRVLYIGVTNNLFRRVREHKEQKGSRFTSKYIVTRLVYYEEFSNINEAIDRETQLKWWRREWKNQLVSAVNPYWEELAPPSYNEE